MIPAKMFVIRAVGDGEGEGEGGPEVVVVGQRRADNVGSFFSLPPALMFFDLIDPRRHSRIPHRCHDGRRRAKGISLWGDPPGRGHHIRPGRPSVPVAEQDEDRHSP